MTKKQIHLLIAPILAIVLTFCIRLNFNQEIALGISFVMVYWWIAEPIAIFKTALVPFLFALPATLLFSQVNLISVDQVIGSYFHHLIFLFLGGFLLAKALEKYDLHVEISRFIISVFGTSAKRIVIGFMLSTAFLSMWISNTATTLMMLPMALSVCKVIEEEESKKKFTIGLLLSLAFAANVGGTATIVGTPPNTLLIANLEESYHISIDFFQWMKLGVPFALIMLIVIYTVLYFLFFRGVNVKTSFAKANRLNREQWTVLIVFFITVLLWIFRKEANTLLSPYLFGFQIKDSTIAMFMALWLFVLPAQSNKRLLHLKDIKSISWNILILFGGGLALAKILAETGLVKLIIDSIVVSETTSLLLVFGLITVFALFATELMSNMALVSVLVPLVGQFALDNNYPLVQLTAAVALASSCAFMLPVATPPNAIVFSSGHINVKTMMRAGILINLVAIIVIIFMVRNFL